jgi:hypothetical protein
MSPYFHFLLDWGRKWKERDIVEGYEFTTCYLIEPPPLLRGFDVPREQVRLRDKTIGF